MTRSKSSGDLGTRTDRAKLPIRKEPHWLVLEKGRALGYAKGASGGTWIARYYNPAAHPGLPLVKPQVAGAGFNLSPFARDGP